MTVALSILIMSFLVFPSQSLMAQTGFDSEAMGLGMPLITINPSSGPPGTQVEIKITNIPPVPKDIDPRTEFFIFLPFVPAIGSNVPHNCAGEYCLPVYSFEEIGLSKLAPKTITFTLFSTSNPKPIVLGGFMESVCDLKINGKTIERYGNTCNGKNQPLQDYEIKFAWGIQRSDTYDIKETLVFTVTEGILEAEEKKPETAEEKKPETESEQKTNSPTEPEELINADENGGGCLIATATYGSELAPQVQMLREIRDNSLLQTQSGQSFMQGFNSFYYSFSPTIADYERQNPFFKETVKLTITPLITSLSLLNYVEIDSEAEVLGYGISLILLNIGMYFVAPAIVISIIVNRSNVIIRTESVPVIVVIKILHTDPIVGRC